LNQHEKLTDNYYETTHYFQDFRLRILPWNLIPPECLAGTLNLMEKRRLFIFN